MDIEKLQQTVESVGCEMKRVGFRELYVMLPANFPWYGKDNVLECDNSRIIAAATLSIGTWDWTDAVWPMPGIHIEHGKPLGIVMRKNGLHSAGSTLRNFSYEQIADWLQKKIGEVSKKAKECRKLMITYKSKEYEA